MHMEHEVGLHSAQSGNDYKQGAHFKVNGFKTLGAKHVLKVSVNEEAVDAVTVR